MTYTKILKAVLTADAYARLPKSRLVHEMLCDLACGQKAWPIRLSGNAYIDNTFDTVQAAKELFGEVGQMLVPDVDPKRRESKFLQLTPEALKSDLAIAIRILVENNK